MRRGGLTVHQQLQLKQHRLHCQPGCTPSLEPVTSVQLNLLALTDNDYNDGVLKLHVSLFSWGEAGSDQPQYDHMARIAGELQCQKSLRTVAPINAPELPGHGDGLATNEVYLGSSAEVKVPVEVPVEVCLLLPVLRFELRSSDRSVNYSICPSALSSPEPKSESDESSKVEFDVTSVNKRPHRRSSIRHIL
ncbi:hypothetical protein E3U43_013473 [Larimichthys crocea]|uniref:Uncharacterized protein n=1 Tax=Larimichthys crocea TaxID=215358 RepID=A0ACD3R9W3_LARCR|nr:hypothetical protein E3U43_013473 [Larimichthys crocea]